MLSLPPSPPAKEKAKQRRAVSLQTTSPRHPNWRCKRPKGTVPILPMSAFMMIACCFNVLTQISAFWTLPRKGTRLKRFCSRTVPPPTGRASPASYSPREFLIRQLITHQIHQCIGRKWTLIGHLSPGPTVTDPTMDLFRKFVLMRIMETVLTQ